MAASFPIGGGGLAFSSWNRNLRCLQPVMGFYTKMPDDAKCIFSRQKRAMKHILPRRTVGLWGQEKIQAQADTIRASYPNEAKSVVDPKKWEDLWEYFDAHDLYFAGSWNLRRVIELLFEENAIDNYDRDMFDAITDWAYTWLALAQNRQKLSQWDTQIDILSIFNAEDWEKVRTTEPVVMSILRRSLKYWYDYFCENGFDICGAESTPLPNTVESHHQQIESHRNLQHGHARAAQPHQSSSKGSAANAGNSPSSSSSSRTLSGWVATGVDPIHGPIVQRTAGPSQERKDQPGSGSGSGSAPNTECKNQDKRKLHHHQFHKLSFAACTCKKCEESSRSIYVTVPYGGEELSPENLRMLLEYFGRWGQVESSLITNRKSCLIRFKSDMSAETIGKLALGVSIPSISKQRIFVRPAFFSKHYQPKQMNTGSLGDNSVDIQTGPSGPATPDSDRQRIASVIQPIIQHGVYYHSPQPHGYVSPPPGLHPAPQYYGPAQHYSSTTGTEQRGQPAQERPVYSYDGGVTQLGEQENTGTVIRREVQTRGRLPSEWEVAGTSSAEPARVLDLPPVAPAVPGPVPAAPVSPVADKTGGSTNLPTGSRKGKAQTQPKNKTKWKLKNKGKGKNATKKAAPAAAPADATSTNLPASIADEAVDPGKATAMVEMEPEGEKTAEQKGKGKATDPAPQPAAEGRHRADTGGSLKLARTRKKKKPQPAEEEIVVPAAAEPEPEPDRSASLPAAAAAAAEADNSVSHAVVVDENRRPFDVVPGWPRGFDPFPRPPMRSTAFRAPTCAVRKDNDTLAVWAGGGGGGARRPFVSHSAHTSLNSTGAEYVDMMM
ncbi:hypothetical protein QBC37DRAFT_167576 [Rhypophila decipiens]|uniref:RRM domain-containing protein n=1 Tax=Rhypophila decipiens TaxID=261697 RepID=A0AAN7BCS6_9PEZI|nr:hypothetical protein QBC37DRAFT_167576 [Rhypophila decipiens]